ncbi:MAG: glutathione S-transferase family protein [Gaiellaceae bacterium]
MRLWYRPGSAALAPHAALAEIGVDYELAEVGFEDPAEADPEFLRLNPAGRVPTLEDGDFVLTESAAIMLYLAERFPEARLLPDDKRERAQVYRWLVYLTNTLQPAFMRFFYPHRYGADAVREGAALEEHFDWIDGELAGRTWLVGDDRTVADLFLWMLVRWGRRLDRPAWDRPNVRAYFLRLLERPPLRRVLEEQGLELPALS